MGHRTRQDINPRGYSKWPLERFVRAAHEGDVELLGKMPLRCKLGFQSGEWHDCEYESVYVYIYILYIYMNAYMDESMDEYMEDCG